MKAFNAFVFAMVQTVVVDHVGKPLTAYDLFWVILAAAVGYALGALVSAMMSWFYAQDPL